MMDNKQKHEASVKLAQSICDVVQAQFGNDMTEEVKEVVRITLTSTLLGLEFGCTKISQLMHRN